MSAQGLPQPGHTLGRYALQRLLGQGGMGAVYLAGDPVLRRYVAIKVVLPELAGAGDMLERFQREAQALAALDHPGIVKVHEAGAAGGLPYLVLDFVEGESLQARLKRDGPLPLRDAAGLVRQLAKALQHAHQRGVLHRDLKPENVLVGPDGQPRVTDFGLARILDREALTRTGQVLGTPAYMAPEQAGGEIDRIGPCTDVYGLGAVLYALLTGQPPFPKAPQMQMLAAVLMKEPQPPSAHRPDVPTELERVCLHCLEKEPEDRYAAAADLADDLERWLAGDPIQAQPPTAGRRVRRWAKRHRSLVVGSLAILAALVLGGVGYLVIQAIRAAEEEKERDATKEKIAQARKAYSEGRPQDAIDILLKLETELDDDAQELLRDCYEKQAKELTRRTKHGKLLGESGEFAAVVASWTGAIEVEPTALRYERRAYAYDLWTAERALGYADGDPQQSLDAAIADYGKAAELLEAEWPATGRPPWELHWNRGRLLALALDREGSERACRRALDALGEQGDATLHERRRSIILFLARQETFYGEHAAADRFIQVAQDEEGGDRDYRVHLARAVLKREREGRMSQTPKHFDLARDLCPESARVEVGIERALALLGTLRSFEEGKAALEGLREAESHPTYWGAKVMVDMSQQGELGAFLMRRLFNPPDRSQFRKELGPYLDAREGCRVSLHNALRRDPRLPIAWGGVAWLQLTEEDADRARQNMEVATRLWPQTAPVWNVRGWVATTSGESAAAERAYSRALQLDPTNFMAAWGRAPLRIAKGDTAGAREDLAVCRGAMTFLFGMGSLILGRLPEEQRAAQAEFGAVVLILLGERFDQVGAPGEVTKTLTVLDQALRNLRQPVPEPLRGRLEALRAKAR